MDKCKLCNETFEKFPKSHIIPNFMYKYLKNEKSQILRIHMPEGKRLKPIFTGYYQQPFLCFSCEKRFSTWENYAEKILYGSTNLVMPKVKNTSDPLIQSVTNIDYAKFKLFLLSILWRASETTNEFFKEVSLGEVHTKRLSELLLNDDPGDEDQYPVMIVYPKGTLGSSLSIGPPYRNKNKLNASRYIFPIGEAIYVYHISTHGLEDIQKIARPKRDNTANIVFWPISRTEAFLQLYDVKAAVQKNRWNKMYNRKS